MSELFVYSSDSEEEINYESLSKSENNNIETELEREQTSNLNNIIFNKLDQKNHQNQNRKFIPIVRKLLLIYKLVFYDKKFKIFKKNKN